MLRNLSRSISRVLFLNQINDLRDGYLSSIYVSINIEQSTRSSSDANNILESFWSCTGWGLHIFWISSNYCSLLHYYFTLTLRRYSFCCTFHSLKKLLSIKEHPVLQCPDFPLKGYNNKLGATIRSTQTPKFTLIFFLI